MKFLLFLLFMTSNLFAAQDTEWLRATGKKLSKTEFFGVINALKTEFTPLATSHGRKLEFLVDYDEDWAQAFARRWETDQVIVYGGAAALEGGTVDSFALMLCHEIGHLYGGIPYGDEYNKIAVEGQADYWATLECFKKVIMRLPVLIPSRESIGTCYGEEKCARAVDAALILTAFYADNRRIPHPRLDTPDLTKVSSTLRVHPEPQCRLDTMVAALFGKDRPGCWYYQSL